MIIINVTFRYVLPTRLQRAKAVIIIKCNRQVYSTHEVTESKRSDIINVTIGYVPPLTEVFARVKEVWLS